MSIYQTGEEANSEEEKKNILLEGLAGGMACLYRVGFHRWHSNCIQHNLRIRTLKTSIGLRHDTF